MNTQAQDPQRLRALELAVQARRETLSEGDRRFLDDYLGAHPDVASEARELTELLGRLQAARLPVRPAFQDKMRAAVAGWVRDEALAPRRAPAAASKGWLRARWEWLVGRNEAPEGVSTSTLFLGRSLAFYLGAASVICAFLLLREPDPGPEVHTNDRAHTLDDEKPPVDRPTKSPDLRGSRPK